MTRLSSICALHLYSWFLTYLTTVLCLHRSAFGRIEATTRGSSERAEAGATMVF